MRYGKTVLGTLVILAGLTTSVQAQQFGVGGFGGNAFAGNYGGFGYNNFGTNGGLGGYGYQRPYGYANGASSYYQAPQTYNNMGGLANSIVTHTGKANSYRYGYGQMPRVRRR